ncbi:MAG: hypothetical protein AB7O38_26040 [Pirellulaceae bacterium]
MSSLRPPQTGSHPLPTIAVAETTIRLSNGRCARVPLRDVLFIWTTDRRNEWAIWYSSDDGLKQGKVTTDAIFAALGRSRSWTRDRPHRIAVSGTSFIAGFGHDGGDIDFDEVQFFDYPEPDTFEWHEDLVRVRYRRNGRVRECFADWTLILIALGWSPGLAHNVDIADRVIHRA